MSPEEHIEFPCRICERDGLGACKGVGVADLRTALADARELIQGWWDWFNGPYSEGVGYINPPLRRTAECLNRIDSVTDKNV